MRRARDTCAAKRARSLEPDWRVRLRYDACSFPFMHSRPCLVVAAFLALVIALTGACTSSSGGDSGDGRSCFEDPSVCPAGTTCWPTGNESTTWYCLPADADAGLRSACAQGATPSCPAGVLCVGLPLSSSPPICEPRC